MIRTRRAGDRGHADYGWLKSQHTFSFASYHDPEQRGFRSLRVMNEDRVAAGKGFDTHSHRDMEIVSYVLEGALEHKDSMGNGETLEPGEFQRISAGTGITHSEFNPSLDAPTHFYQIWILPARSGIEPSYEQKSFDPAGRRNQMQLVASPDGAGDSLLIHQDARIYLADIDQGRSIQQQIDRDRHVWLQVLGGTVALGQVVLQVGDGAAISDHSTLNIQARSGARLMAFDLA